MLQPEPGLLRHYKPPHLLPAKLCVLREQMLPERLRVLRDHGLPARPYVLQQWQVR